MLEYTIIGMLLALLAGMVNAFGAILQKGVVNRLPVETRDTHFMYNLLHNPTWQAGFWFSMGLGTIFTLQSQKMIGPALNPGLSSAGLMITLAIGSAKYLGEKLSSSDMLGIFLMIGGIFCLGYSDLGIISDQVDITRKVLILRIALFSLSLILLWLLSFIVAPRLQGSGRGLMLSVSGGFLYSLSNLWLLPLIVTIGPVFRMNAQIIEVILFILACVFLVSTNVGGIRIVQEAYKFSPASLVQPLQLVPTQIIPILMYYWVFQRSSSGIALLLIPLGVSLIVISGALLGRFKS